MLKRVDRVGRLGQFLFQRFDHLLERAGAGELGKSGVSFEAVAAASLGKSRTECTIAVLRCSIWRGASPQNRKRRLIGTLRFSLGLIEAHQAHLVAWLTGRCTLEPGEQRVGLDIHPEPFQLGQQLHLGIVRQA